jgi:hypothetical protein
MSWIVKDFVCNSCGEVFEELYKRGKEDEVNCVYCLSHNTSLNGISAPALGTFSMADAAGRASILKKRSEDHTRQTVLKNADRFGAAGYQRRNEYLGKK